jgi:hypothetical protein
MELIKIAIKPFVDGVIGGRDAYCCDEAEAFAQQVSFYSISKFYGISKGAMICSYAMIKLLLMQPRSYITAAAYQVAVAR